MIIDVDNLTQHSAESKMPSNVFLNCSNQNLIYNMKLDFEPQYLKNIRVGYQNLPRTLLLDFYL